MQVVAARRPCVGRTLKIDISLNPLHVLIFQETTYSRRIVGRVEAGEDFIEALTELCEEHQVRAGRLEAIGTFSQAELVKFMPQTGDYQTHFGAQGVFDIISLSGNISTLGEAVALRVECLLSVEAPAGQQLISGQLRSAEATSVEFVLDIFEDLAVERRLDPETGRLNIRSIQRVKSADPAPAGRAAAPKSAPAKAPRVERTPQPSAAEPSAPIAGKSLSWKDAAVEATQAPEGAGHQTPSAQELYAGVDLSEPAIESGDILEHPKLGRCRVMKVEDGEFVHVRLPRGKIRKLSLDIVAVEFDREENGRSIFRAVIGR